MPKDGNKPSGTVAKIKPTINSIITVTGSSK